jgi:CheY-like chemotaxis protein
MEGPECSTWLAGDFEDPWVVAIASALPRALVRIDGRGDLPEVWPAGVPSAIVLHRLALTASDLVTVSRLRSRLLPSTKLILIVSPHVRYVDVERWSRLVDVVLPEGTAPFTVARHVLDLKPPHPPRSRPRVAVISSNYELRRTLADAVRASGYAVEPVLAPSESSERLAVWDVPVLDPEWPAKLAALAKAAAVVALLGMADRTTVARAMEAGASSCLDLPCDVEDLALALARVELGVHAGHRGLKGPFAWSGLNRRLANDVQSGARDDSPA